MYSHQDKDRFATATVPFAILTTIAVLLATF